MENIFKGTKGPWHISLDGFNSDRGNVIGVYSANDDLEAICQVPKDMILIHSVQNNLANANLISASPELLEALIKISDFIDDNETVNYKIRLLSREVPNIKQLINKALGNKL